MEELKEKFIEFWQENLKPMLEEWGQKFKELWEEHLKPCIEKLMEMLKALWEDVLLPLAEWIIDTLLPVLLPIIDKIFEDSIGWIEWAIDIIGVFADVISNAVGLVADLLRGDWSSAWEHAKNIVKSVWDAITGTIKSAVESITGWIDTILSLFDKAESKKSSFGSGDSGQSYSTRSYSMRSIQSPYAANHAYAALSSTPIPRLATGAVIPANKEFLAVLGDQKHGTNVEAPLSTIEQAVINAMAKVGVVGNGGSSGGNTYNVKAIANGNVIFEMIIEEGKTRMMSSGRNPFDLGTT